MGLIVRSHWGICRAAEVSGTQSGSWSGSGKELKWKLELVWKVEWWWGWGFGDK